MRAHIALCAVAACGRIGFAPSGATGDGGLPPCTTGVCECNADADCTAPHTYCDARAGSHTCDCVAGYSGSPCLWTGVVADPGFQQTTVWTTTGTISPTTSQAGMVEPGLVDLVAFERASQTVTMPRRSLAQPLVLLVSAERTGANDRPSVGLGKYWIDTTAGVGWTATRSCLGAAMYAPESSTGAGVPLTLQVMPTTTANKLHVDHVDVVPANDGECAAPGAVANGDAEGSGNWTFAAVPINGPDGTSAGFVAGVGDNGSRGAQLHTTMGCDQANLSLQISSLPFEQFASPALAFWVDGSSGAPIEFTGAAAPAQAVGTGAPATPTACLPAPVRGMPFTLSAVTDGTNPSCLAAQVFDVVFDDVALVSATACGTDQDITDPGFESEAVPFGVTLAPPYSSATIDTSVVHGGAASLKLGATFTCNSPVAWKASVFPPASVTGAGPALEFYYNATPVNHFVLTVVATGASATLVQDGTWRRGIVCFDPQLAGRSQTAQFALGDTGNGACAVMVPEETVNIDDLALITDSSCPP